MEDNYYYQKLMHMPERFRHLYSRKEWAAAKACYDDAIVIAQFLELHQEERDKLFGNRQDEEHIVVGMFDEEMVQRTYYECAVKRNLGRENRPYKPPWEV